jgi:trehalose 6-phosphate phosphatase
MKATPERSGPSGRDRDDALGWLTRDSALFLDFDGTLAELAPAPDRVEVSPHLPPLLARLGQLLGGALAVVSGRPVAEIDHQLSPLKLCVAGVHGAERRGTDGYLRRIPMPALDAAAVPIAALCAQFPALRMERKPGAIALHYRQAPELEQLCLATMEEALRRVEGVGLMRGKMVVEMKPSRANKAMAVGAFMERSPFRSRRPWFFGDDVTDESAFEYVQSIGGVAVRVGAGETLAAHRLPDTAAVHAWLERAADRLSARRAEGSR